MGYQQPLDCHLKKPGARWPQAGTPGLKTTCNTTLKFHKCIPRQAKAQGILISQTYLEAVETFMDFSTQETVRLLNHQKIFTRWLKML